MVQSIVVIFIVAAAAVYAGLQVYRFFAPKRVAGKICGGSCCSAGSAPAPAAPPAPRTQMITSDSLRARIKARHA